MLKIKENIINKMKNKEGFTLIELIVVIAILGILAMLIMPNIMGFTKDAQKSVAGQQFKVLDQAYLTQKALGTELPAIADIDSIATADDLDLTKVLGDSVKGIKCSTLTLNTDKTSLGSAIIKIKTESYTCTAQADGTVLVTK